MILNMKKGDKSMKKLFILIAIMALMIACSDNIVQPPGNNAPIITSINANPRLIKMCPVHPCGAGYVSALDCSATDIDKDVLWYSWKTDPPSAGINQADPRYGGASFEAQSAAIYVVSCTACDRIEGGKCATSGLIITVCDNC
jgi:hypothetical protein